MSDENKKHEGEKKHHEKRIVGRVNHNNINLSHHAKHDWHPVHHERHNARMDARAKRAAEPHIIPSTMIIRAYFQKLDRVGGGNGQLIPANDPVFDGNPLVQVMLPLPAPGTQAGYIDITISDQNTIATFSAKDLLAKIEETYGDYYYPNHDPNNDPVPPYASIFLCDPDPKTTFPVPPALYYLSSIAIKDSPGSPFLTNGAYTPIESDEDVNMRWAGWAWMFFDGPPGAPYWEPQDNLPWDINNPDGEDGYPNGTLDEYEPLYELLHYDEEEEVYPITFSYENQCFEFLYEPQEVDGVTHMVLVIRPLRRKVI